MYPVQRGGSRDTHGTHTGHTHGTPGTELCTGKKTPGGAGTHTGHARDTRAHKVTRTTQTNLTTIQTHQQHTSRTSQYGSTCSGALVRRARRVVRFVGVRCAMVCIGAEHSLPTYRALTAATRFHKKTLKDTVGDAEIPRHVSPIAGELCELHHFRHCHSQIDPFRKDDAAPYRSCHASLRVLRAAEGARRRRDQNESARIHSDDS